MAIPRRYGIQYKMTDTNGKSTTKTVNGLNFPDDDATVPEMYNDVETWRKQIARAFVTDLSGISNDTLASISLIRYEEVL